MSQHQYAYADFQVFYAELIQISNLSLTNTARLIGKPETCKLSFLRTRPINRYSMSSYNVYGIVRIFRIAYTYLCNTFITLYNHLIYGP